MRAVTVGLLLAAALLAPGSALAVCAVEGRLEAVRLSLEETTALVVHIRQPRAVVPNAFHMERPATGGLGDIPTVVQFLHLASSSSATVLAVGDLPACPDAAEMERARGENKAARSGRLLWVLVKYK